MEAINISNALAVKGGAAATVSDGAAADAAGHPAGFGTLLTQQLHQALGKGASLGVGEVSMLAALKADAAVSGDSADLAERLSALMQDAQSTKDGLSAGRLATSSTADASLDDEGALGKLQAQPEIAVSVLMQTVGKKADTSAKDGKNLPAELPVDAASDPVTDAAALAAMIGVQMVPQVQQPIPQTKATGLEKELPGERRPVSLGEALNKGPTTQMASVSAEPLSKLPAESPQSVSPPPVEPQVNAQSFSALMAERAATNANVSVVPTLEVPQRVDSPGWGTGVGDKVVWMVGSQNQSAELKLNPPSLGPLEVRVSMHDGQATLSFITPHAPVREAIEAATPRLREMLGDSGVSLGGVSVNVGTFAQQQSTPQGGQGQQQGSTRQWGGFDEAEDSGYAAPVVTSVRYLRDGGMVDLFA